MHINSFKDLMCMQPLHTIKTPHTCTGAAPSSVTFAPGYATCGAHITFWILHA